MSLDDFLNSKGKNTSSSHSSSAIIDIPETAALLGNTASSFFDSLASQVGDGLTKIQKETGSLASSTGKTIGVVKEDGSSNISLFAPSEEDPILKHMTKKQRILGFIGCILMGMFCFSFAAALLPVLVVSSRKFALQKGYFMNS